MAALTKPAQQVSLPALDEVLRNSACLESLYAHTLAALALKANALACIIAARLALVAAEHRDPLKPRPKDRPEIRAASRTISAEEACALLHQPRYWLFRNARRLPFVIRLSHKKLICDETLLRAWLAAHASAP